MKLFALAIAAAQAQDTFDFPSLGDFDLSSFGLGPDSFNIPVAPVADLPDEERYFFTTAATTTATTTPTTTTLASGEQCFKCDAMTYATCASGGSYEVCPLGDRDCCFVEMRETRGALQQLCTGCKAAQACEDNKGENFQGAIPQHHQCRPDYRYQRFGQRANQQSTCRQCFNKCDPNTDKDACFGAVDSGTPKVLKLALVANSASYPWGSANLGAMGRTDSEYADALGIPTGFIIDDQSNTVLSAITGLTDLLNVYTLSGTSGKTSTANGDSTYTKATEQLFWGLQGADQTWWSSNLKTIQNAATNDPTTVTQLK